MMMSSDKPTGKSFQTPKDQAEFDKKTEMNMDQGLETPAALAAGSSASTYLAGPEEAAPAGGQPEGHDNIATESTNEPTKKGSTEDIPKIGFAVPTGYEKEGKMDGSQETPNLLPPSMSECMEVSAGSAGSSNSPQRGYKSKAAKGSKFSRKRSFEPLVDVWDDETSDEPKTKSVKLGSSLYEKQFLPSAIPGFGRLPSFLDHVQTEEDSSSGGLDPISEDQNSSKPKWDELHAKRLTLIRASPVSKKRVNEQHGTAKKISETADPSQKIADIEDAAKHLYSKRAETGEERVLRSACQAECIYSAQCPCSPPPPKMERDVDLQKPSSAPKPKSPKKQKKVSPRGQRSSSKAAPKTKEIIAPIGNPFEASEMSGKSKFHPFIPAGYPEFRYSAQMEQPMFESPSICSQESFQMQSFSFVNPVHSLPFGNSVLHDEISEIEWNDKDDSDLIRPLPSFDEASVIGTSSPADAGFFGAIWRAFCDIFTRFISLFTRQRVADGQSKAEKGDSKEDFEEQE